MLKETNFDEWEWEDLTIAFGLKWEKESALLTEWTQAQLEFSEIEKRQLSALQDAALRRGNDLNEDEVKMVFIAPMLYLAGFPYEPYAPFTQRQITATIGDYILTGKPDFILASGITQPREPFFLLQEYKPAKLRDKLPLGQLLAAMISAQHLNGEAHAHPILGATVIATNWNFIVLEGNSFSVSPPFDIIKDDIFRIPAILRAVNGYIMKWLKP